jgi:antitoxin component YwqK of YwqJK toxin-antitoxin module
MTAKKAPIKKFEVIEGYTIKYHANGITRWSKGIMENGKPSGYWEWYRPDGTLKRSGYFLKGEPVGEWTTYDSEGKVYKVTKRSPSNHSVINAENCPV